MKILKAISKFIQKRAIRIDKRVRLVASILTLGLLLLLSTFFYFDWALFFIPLIVLVTYLLTYFVLLEGIGKMSWFGLFIMPVAVSVSFYLFYFLIPSRWLTRIPFLVFYEISIYAVLLCSNIFNVGVEKNLGLYRAAFSINILYHAVVTFLIFNLIFALKSYFIVNAAAAGITATILSLNLFWTIRLKRHLEPEVLRFALLTGLIIFELALLVSFLPLKGTVYSLFLTGVYYGVTGLTYNYMDQRLFKETIREFITVLVFVLIVTILSLTW